MEESRSVRVGLNFPPEAQNRQVDRPRQWRFRIPPHLPKQLVAIDNPVAALRQVTKQFDLAVSEVNRAPLYGGRLLLQINGHIAKYKAINRDAGATQHDIHSRQQFLKIKWLCHVI